MPDARADTPQQIAAVHFRAGLKLFERSDYEGARLEFLQAQAVFARPSLLRNLALCELKTHRPLEAIQHLRAYLADASTTDEKRENAKKSLDEAFAQTGHASVHANDGAVLSVDGQAQPGTAPFRAPFDTIPGHHVLEAQIGTRRTTRDVDLPAGVMTEVDLRFVPDAAAPSDARTGTTQGTGGSEVLTPPREPRPSFWNTRHTFGVAAAGLAIVAGGVGGGLLFARDGHVSDGKDALAERSSPCAQPSSAACSKYDGARDGIKDTEVGAAIAIGAFVALGVTAAALIFWPDSRRNARLRVRPFGRDLALTGTF